MKPILAGLAIALCAAAQSPLRFEDATKASGIGFVHSFGAQKLGSLLESTGSGCAWFDYNNDGRLDLFVANGRPLAQGIHPYPLRKPPTPLPHSHLYRNDGNGKFTDVTASTGLAADLFSFAAAAADIDNDGHTDLAVTGYGRLILYRNLGNGRFEDITAKAGVETGGWSIGAAWLDYDRDGCIDLFVGRYVKFDPKYRSYYAADNYPGPLDYEGETNRLYRNQCNGTFTDASEKAGIAPYKGRAMGVTAADFDGDGYADIYVANDKTENFLFHNQKNGTFREIAADAGAAFGQNGESTSAMGPVFVDFDNDGKTDLWVSDSKYNRLLRNVGQTQLRDVTEHAGISQLTAQYVSWGTFVEDFDNDGHRDIALIHGGLIHMVPQEHSLFRNLGQGRFEDVSAQAGPVFDAKTVGRGGCSADYDNDGLLDFYMVNLGSPGVLFHNTSAPKHHWLAVKLIGRKSNRDGIGAVVEVTAGGRAQTLERAAGSGYLSQNDPRLHFGLGSAAKAETVVIRWPSGAVQTLENIPAGRTLTVEEK
ncbi:MAG: CRTAC1 family protein [Bryobacteraceae bacterium]|nr:CRTAC1 family protein [Bryobacteraceae bacterium]